MQTLAYVSTTVVILFVIFFIYNIYDTEMWIKKEKEKEEKECEQHKLEVLELLERDEQEEAYFRILEQLKILNTKYKHKVTEEQLRMITCKQYNNLSREKIQEIVGIPMEHLLIYGCILPRDTRLRTQKLLRS